MERVEMDSVVVQPGLSQLPDFFQNLGPIADIERYNEIPGKCIIVRFTDPKIKGAATGRYTKEESDEDVQRVKGLFSDLGYEVEIMTNYRDGSENYGATEIENKLKLVLESKESQGKKFGSLIVFILTEGTDEFKLKSCKGDYDVNELVNQCAGNSSAWIDVPKVFIIQAYGTQTEDDYIASSKSAVEKPLILPKLSDYFYAFACHPGFPKPKVTKPQGENFIQKLCRVIDEHGKENDLESLLDILRNNIIEAHKKDHESSPSSTTPCLCPTPISVSTLRKLLFLK